MIMRAMGLGFLLWLAVAAAFRFFGQVFFIPDETPRLIAFISAPVIGAAAAFVLLKLLAEAQGDEGEASIGVALPILFLNGFLTHEFPTAFPNIDSTLDATFGAWSLLFCGSILFTGLSMTKLAPRKFTGQMMGVWFTATALGNLFAGLVGGNVDPEKLQLMPQLFQRTSLSLLAAAVVLLALVIPIRRMMADTKNG